MFFANAWSTGANGGATGGRYLAIPDGPEPWVYVAVMVFFTFLGCGFMHTGKRNWEGKELWMWEGIVLVCLFVLFLIGITICGFTIWKSVT